MKSEFKAKLLQHVLSKKDSEKGFTLIELLVVIIIIGILAAIALPSFLNQSNKAKQSEAKTYVGTLNKGQQAYFTEKNRFGSSIDILGIGVKQDTVNYNYSTRGSAYNAAVASANNATSYAVPTGVALRAYNGMVQLNQVDTTSDITSLAILCEANAPGPSASTIFPTPVSSGGPICSANSQAVGN